MKAVLALAARSVIVTPRGFNPQRFRRKPYEIFSRKSIENVLVSRVWVSNHAVTDSYALSAPSGSARSSSAVGKAKWGSWPLRNARYRTSFENLPYFFKCRFDVAFWETYLPEAVNITVNTANIKARRRRATGSGNQSSPAERRMCRPAAATEV